MSRNMVYKFADQAVLGSAKMALGVLFWQQWENAQINQER